MYHSGTRSLSRDFNNLFISSFGSQIPQLMLTTADLKFNNTVLKYRWTNMFSASDRSASAFSQSKFCQKVSNILSNRLSIFSLCVCSRSLYHDWLTSEHDWLYSKIDAICLNSVRRRRFLTKRKYTRTQYHRQQLRQI